MKRLITILLLLFTFASVDAQRAGWWYGNAPGEAAAGPDTLTLTYWNDFILLHIANTGITEDANGVSQWQDRSGNGNHSTQTINANKPISDVDGNIVFSGTGDYLNMPSLMTTPSQFTFFMIWDNTHARTVSENVFSYNDTSNDVFWRIDNRDDAVSGDSSLVNYLIWDGTAGAAITIGDTSTARKEMISVISALENDSVYVRTNGQIIDNKPIGIFENLTGGSPRIGSNRQATGGWFGNKILFIGIVDRKMTPAEIATTESELNSFFTIY